MTYNGGMDTLALAISTARRALQRGEIAPLELTHACLRQIERLNPTLNAFITVYTDVTPALAPGASVARGRAERNDRRGRSRSASSAAMTLAGIPLALKDLFETAGVLTTAGSLFFKDHIPAQDAAVVQRLKADGAVILGKTNTHEIALGVTTNNPHFGACRNPWDAQRIPGGSSGGSAVAVATGMALGALGTDTGGSIRIPAALCGVVGLKPTYGRVSLRGVIPLSWNLDHVGPLARAVRDVALLLEVIAGYDAEDPASTDVPVDDYLADIEAGVKGWRVALAVGEYVEASDPEVWKAVKEAANVFRKLGAGLVEVKMNLLREAALANGIMTQADGAAFHRERLAEHPEWFGADVRQRLQAGRDCTSTDYSLARRTQTEMEHRFAKFFEDYDLLLLPSTPIPAPFIEGNDAVEQARRLTRFTAPFNLTGLPALSLPCGFSHEGLPIGLQIVAPRWGEARALRAAYAYEQATEWHLHRPPAE